jgi:hypothetical protein
MKLYSLLLTASLLLLFCFSGSVLFADPSYGTVFTNGVYNGNQIDILYYSQYSESLIFNTTAGAVTQAMVPWNGLGDWQTCTIAMPVSSNIGFYRNSPEVSVTPMFWGETGTPPLSYFSPQETDPLGDHLFTSAWLDIVRCDVCYSEERLYFAIRNNHTAFPVSSGLTYYAYMPLLLDPAALPGDDPIVFGLMYTINIAGIMSPGLYKITGTGLGDLNRIGDLQSSIVDQTLVLSCALADLYADQDFMAWFNPNYPLVSTSATSSKITLTAGSQQADMTTGAKLLLSPVILPATNEFAPVLSAPLYAYEPGEQPTLMASILYSDADANFPSIATISVDGGIEHPLVPDGNFHGNFLSGERYTSETIYLTNYWNQIRFRFSHGDGFVYHTLQSSANDDDVLLPAPQFNIYPNPAAGFISIKSSSPVAKEVKIYNQRGQIVLTGKLTGAMTDTKLDISQLKPGLYFVQDSAGKTTPRKFVKL